MIQRKITKWNPQKGTWIPIALLTDRNLTAEKTRPSKKAKNALCGGSRARVSSMLPFAGAWLAVSGATSQPRTGVREVLEGEPQWRLPTHSSHNRIPLCGKNSFEVSKRNGKQAKDRLETLMRENKWNINTLQNNFKVSAGIWSLLL